MKKDFKKVLDRLANAAQHPLKLPPPDVPAGTLQNDGSIYLGKYEPAGLGKTFNIFSAARDIDLHDYEGTAKLLARNNRGAGRFDTEAELHTALASDTYRGGWVIPPIDILRLLYKHAQDGAFRGTFKSTYSLAKNIYDAYWSSSPGKNQANAKTALRFKDGKESDVDPKYPLHCRPVRLEEIKP